MGGSNPYVRQVEVKKPRQSYTITFLPMQEQVVVRPDQLPYSREGLVGSILEIAKGHDIDVDHACGGVCACSTCHVILREGGDSCQEPTDDELDRVDEAPGNTPDSRLACQAVPNGTCDIVVEVPDWNRNHVTEDDH